MTRPEQPEFGLATRGLIAFHAKVRTGERDMHSGYYGGAALNAIHALTQALSTLYAKNGLLPDQLRVGRAALSESEVESLKKLPSGAEVLLEGGSAFGLARSFAAASSSDVGSGADSERRRRRSIMVWRWGCAGRVRGARSRG